MGSGAATRTCSSGTTTARAAARRSRPSSSANSTRRSAAGRSTASPTRAAPGSNFDWFRSRMLGGRTNHWGRISLRFGPDDFRRKSLDGLGDDWPITYDDIKPFYDEVDKLIGIFGTNLGPRFPNEPDGFFLPPPHAALLRAADQAGVGEAGHPVRARRGCRSSRSPYNGRMACHYCGQCNRGCATHSNFSSPSVLLPPAMATGKLTIIANAMAREVTVDEAGLATRRGLHRQDERPRQPRPGPHRRRSPRAPASRRASCSIRSRRSSRRASATRPAPSAST